MRKALLITTAVVALITTTAGGCDKPAKPQDKFTRDCMVRGGHATTERKGHSIVRVCLPPIGGWQ